MNLQKLSLVVMAMVLGSYACGTGDDDATDDTASTSDEVIFTRGNADHAAIVESTTIMLVATPTIAPPLDKRLDRYNVQDPFAIGAGDFRPTFATNIAKFDALDGVDDWSPDQRDVWADRMASANYLVVDTEKPCDFDAPATYLEIERAHLQGNGHTTCGGRLPNEDALDTTINFLVGGPDNDGAQSDGVDAPTQPASSSFPYLAELNGF